MSGVENSRLETLADEERRKEREKEKEEKEIKKMNFIKKILSECQPLEGTLAEEYLRNIRGIENISGENLKFHPGFTTRVSCFIPSNLVSVQRVCGSTPLNLTHAWWSTLWSSVANHQ